MNYTKLLACALLMLLFACKKNGNDTPDQDNDINPSDSKSLFQNIKINHGQKLDGSLPAASQNGPVLGETIADQTLPCIAGKYVIIRPKVLSGEIAGYYFHIAGYNDAYFKIDFSKPISGRKKIKVSKRYEPFKKVMDDNPDYMDSVIVIQLPKDIKPGTFCTEYIAYDWDNNTSNVVKQCITVSSIGGEEKLTGKWSAEKYKYSIEDWKSYPIIDTSYLDYYECGNDNKPFIVYDYQVTTPSVPGLRRKYDYYYYRFSADGSGEDEYNEIELKPDFNKSSCNNWVFNSKEYIGNDPLIWSYDSARKKLIIIFDYADPEYTYFYELDITFISQNRFATHYWVNNGVGEEEWGEFVKIQ